MGGSGGGVSGVSVCLSVCLLRAGLFWFFYSGSVQFSSVRIHFASLHFFTSLHLPCLEVNGIGIGIVWALVDLI